MLFMICAGLVFPPEKVGPVRWEGDHSARSWGVGVSYEAVEWRPSTWHADPQKVLRALGRTLALTQSKTAGARADLESAKAPTQRR